MPGPCDTTVTLEIPGTTTGGQGGGRVVASGRLLNILIERNRIRNAGLCGIGPVGFFSLRDALEVINIENLTIAANTISSTVRQPLAPADDKAAMFGYGAICLPDVENVIIRDNAITDFGREPGDAVCGIFVLHGEMVEISRNHVLETRDWKQKGSEQPFSNLRGGIVLLLVTPPTLAAPDAFAATSIAAVKSVAPVFIPNLPALRVEHNVVRVPLGGALDAIGFGPFTVVNNHLATGGTVGSEGRPVGTTVQILNLSPSIESETAGATFSQLNAGSYSYSSNLARVTAMPSCGAVLFTNNICQLEARADRQRGIASVAILSLDDLIFNSNQCWLDGGRLTAIVDALLAAGSLQVTSNRFQEATGFPVLASGFTIGALNITSQNISTYCLFATGILQPAIDNNNLSLIPSEVCKRAAGSLKLNFTQ